MQETSYSKETIIKEIKKCEKLIKCWIQELTEVQEELQNSKEEILLLHELI